jgi:hypothetical protein
MVTCRWCGRYTLFRAARNLNSSYLVEYLACISLTETRSAVYLSKLSSGSPNGEREMILFSSLSLSDIKRFN